MKKLILIPLALTASVTPSYAYNLSDAYQLALSNDIQYQIEASNLKAAETQIAQSDAAFKPQISAQANGRWVDNDNTSSSSADFTNTSVGGSLVYSQVLYNGQTSAAQDIAVASVEQAKIALISAKSDLLVRTAEAYLNVLAAQDNLKFAQTEKKAISRQLEQAKKRYEVGLIAITDVKETQASYDNTTAQELAAENQLNISKQSLQLITGPISGEIESLSPDMLLESPQPNDNQYWVDLAVQNNSDVKKALASLKIAEANRKKIQSADDMTLTASGSYGITANDNSLSGDNTDNDTVIGITLNIPLYTGGLSSAQNDQAAAQYEAAKDAVLLQKRIASQKASTLYLSVISGISQIKALQQASNSSQTALDATNAGFEVGTRTSVDVLASVRETYRSQKNELKARYDYLLNLLKLKQAAGQLTDNDIALTNQHFQK